MLSVLLPAVFILFPVPCLSNSSSLYEKAPQPFPITVEKSCQLGKCSNGCVYREPHYATILSVRQVSSKKNQFNIIEY